MLIVCAGCLLTVYFDECGHVCKVPIACRVCTWLWGGEVWPLSERPEGRDLTPETCRPVASATVG